MSWYYGVLGLPKGPAEREELDRMARTGEVQWSTPVWQQGMPDWTSYGELFGIESVRCHECQSTVSKEGTIRYGGLSICAHCKSIYFQKVREGLADEYAVHYGGFWIRAAAHLIDGLVLSVFTVPLSVINQIVIFRLMPNSEATVRDFQSVAGPFVSIEAVFLILVLFISLTYETVCIGRFGTTVGKRIFKLRVVRSDFSKIGYGRAALRYFGKMLSASLLDIGFIMAGVDSEKRTLHDHLLDTRVIKEA
jgi:uncharacterized RDD family membrane protein YckC